MVLSRRIVKQLLVTGTRSAAKSKINFSTLNIVILPTTSTTTTARAARQTTLPRVGPITTGTTPARHFSTCMTKIPNMSIASSSSSSSLSSLAAEDHDDYDDDYDDHKEEEEDHQQNVHVVIDIEDVHQQAINQGSTTYIDPPTGYTVFTELAHLKRGKCCGNRCRHCPYGFENVKDPSVRRPAKARSGDKETTREMVRQILARANGNNLNDNSSTADTGAKNRGIKSKTIRMSKSSTGKKTATKTASSTSTTAATSTPAATATATATTTATATATRTMTASATTVTSKNVPYTRKGDGGSSQMSTGERRSKDDCNFEALGTIDELCSVIGVVYAQLQQRQKEEQQLKNKNEASDDKDGVLYGNLTELILEVMSRLFDIGSHLAKPPPLTEDDGVASKPRTFNPNGLGDGFDPKHIEDLEYWIQQMTEDMPELLSFILPTGTVASAQLHVARTVCRRAERRMVPLATTTTTTTTIATAEQDGDGEAKEEVTIHHYPTCDPNALKYVNRLSDFLFVAARWVNYCEDHDEIEYVLDSASSNQRQRVIRKARPSSHA